MFEFSGKNQSIKKEIRFIEKIRLKLSKIKKNIPIISLIAEKRKSVLKKTLNKKNIDFIFSINFDEKY
jgi:hypothetical protein